MTVASHIMTSRTCRRCALCPQRCRSVHVDALGIHIGAGVPRGLAAIRALGLPHNLGVYGYRDVDFILRKSTGSGGTVPQEPGGGPHSSSLSVRGTALASELLVQRLAAETAACAAATASAVGGLASSRPMLHLVLLQSPLFSGLAWSPEALRTWMTQLALQAAVEEEQQAAPAPGGGAPAVAIKQYLSVPSVGAVVLESAAAEAAAAAAAVARRALAAAGFGQSAVVQIHTSDARCFNRLLKRAAQAFWDSGQGGSETERLALLPEMGFELAGESPLVELGDE